MRSQFPVTLKDRSLFFGMLFVYEIVIVNARFCNREQKYVRYDVLRISNNENFEMNVQLRFQEKQSVRYLQGSMILLRFVFHSTNSPFSSKEKLNATGNVAIRNSCGR